MTEPEPASAATMQEMQARSAPPERRDASAEAQAGAEADADALADAGELSGPAEARAAVPREPQWRVARSAIGLWTVEAIIQSLFLLIPAVAAALFVPEDAPGWLVWASDVLPWALAVLLLGGILLLPRYKYAVHRWEVTADGVYTLTGWLSRTWILVPISRIQTVDVTRGPLQRMFGLASVSVRTASAHGSVEIHQLEHYTAAQVADDLSKRANLYDDDAT